VALPLVPIAIGVGVIALALTRKKLPQQTPPQGPLAPGSGPTHVIVPGLTGGLQAIPTTPGGGKVIPIIGPNGPGPSGPSGGGGPGGGGLLGNLPNVVFTPGPAPAPGPVPTPGVTHAMVTTHDTGPTGNLFVRSSPLVEGASPNATPNNIVGSIPHGSIVQVTGPQAGLFLPILVEASGLQGFAAAQFLSVV